MPEAFQSVTFVLELVVSKFVHVPFEWSLDFLQTSRLPSHKSGSFPKLIKGAHLPGAVSRTRVPNVEIEPLAS